MLINGDDNIQFKGDNNIIGDGNTVNNHFYNGSDDKEPPKKEKVLPFTLKVYRRRTFFIDALLTTICFAGMFASVKFHFTLPYLILFFILLCGFWYVLPMIFSSLLVSVYSDRFSIGVEDNDTVFFKDIRWYEWDYKGTFSYKFHDDDVKHSIQFYKYSSAEYLFYRIEQYALFYGLKIPK